MKLHLPAGFSVNCKKGKNRIQQIAFPAAIFDGNLVKFKSDSIDGWRFTSELGECEVYICGRSPKQRLADPAAKVLVFPNVIDPTLDLVAETGYWFQHPSIPDSVGALPTVHKAAEVRQSWRGAFRYVDEDPVNGVIGLRLPQVGALHAIHAHWSTNDEVATIVMPTGTGKTETMLATLVSTVCERVLVIVPTDALRSQIAEKFLSLGVLKVPNCQLLSSTALRPIVGSLKSKPQDVAEVNEMFTACNVVVTTSHIAGQCDIEVKKQLAANCTHLFIDEAHHAEAPTWKEFKAAFSSSKVLQFTATPFREDGKLIDGRTIYTYPLRKAQQEGYFRPIKFASVWEFAPEKADKAIAEMAIAELEADATGKHVVMARAATKERAAEVYAHYQILGVKFNPVVLHTGIPPSEREAAKQKLFDGTSRIVVCVDMLGEGFDMPELKIAAFHDIKKSLAITLQLAGRFTRVRQDLGNATFIANTAVIEVQEELRRLYTQDPDWNALLPELSETAIDEEVAAQEFLRGFESFPSEIPLKDIRPAASTVIYKTTCTNWTPEKFRKGFRGSADFNALHHTINRKEKSIVIAVRRGQQVRWADLPALQDWTWDLHIVFWDPDLNLLFIHGSSNNGEFKDLAKAICGQDVELLVDPVIYRCFHGINRLLLTNVGLNEQFGRQIRYTGRMGADVGSKLSDATRQTTRKVVLAGVGFENGGQATVGAAKRGRVWSNQRFRVDSFVSWCRHIGAKVVNESIDPEEVLKGTLIPKIVANRPTVMPIGVDWPHIIQSELETATSFFPTSPKRKPLSEVGIRLLDAAESGPLKFAIHSDIWQIDFQLELASDAAGIVDYRISCLTPFGLQLGRGGELDACEFFEEHPPVFWFADGSCLEGNQHIELPGVFAAYDREKLCVWDWAGVDLHKESQGLTRDANSIQFRTIRELIASGRHEVIFDDDGSGEAADVVAISVKSEDKRSSIEVDFYHCKYSTGEPGARVADLYEVCGQGQKCVSWLYSQARRTDLFLHLLKREGLRTDAGTVSRFQLGAQADLVRIREMSRVSEVKLRVFLVQPGVSKEAISPSQLALLGVTEKFLYETYQIPFQVIVSA